MTVPGAVAVFVVADLAALLVLGVAVTWVVRTRATSAAVRNARDITVAEGRAAVWPLLTTDVARGDPAALAALDTVVRQRVLSDLIVRVKVWSSSGTILYSDEPRLIGLRFALAADERRALASGQPQADVSDLAEAENLYERPFRKLLQVYDGLRTDAGEPVLFEAYLRFSSVTAESNRTIVSLLPALIGGLAVLVLAQIPLAWRMARRIERSRTEEEALLHRAVTSAEVERRNIAADLHDGPVQALAGTALTLSAAAERATRGGNAELAGTIADAGAELRQTVRDLRTLIVAIAPPRLHEEGLPAALDDLVSPLRARGISVDVVVDAGLDLPPGAEALAYRAAQEAVRNIARHAPEAGDVRVSLCVKGRDVVLEVSDNGPGFPVGSDERPNDGHVGLRLLRDLAVDAGGGLDITSSPGEGTLVALRLPAR